MIAFNSLLNAFAAAVMENDGPRLAKMFTEDGTYEDGFFGAHTGREAIAAMLQRFHDTGRDYLLGIHRPGEQRDNRIRAFSLQLRIAFAGERRPPGPIRRNELFSAARWVHRPLP